MNPQNESTEWDDLKMLFPLVTGWVHPQHRNTKKDLLSQDEPGNLLALLYSPGVGEDPALASLKQTSTE